jgi:hypothetical protein
VGEDGEQDAVHAGFVLESTHWPCPSSDLSKAALDGVGCSSGATLSFGFVTEAGEQLVEVVAQTGDSRCILALEALCEAPQRQSGRQGHWRHS